MVGQSTRAAFIASADRTGTVFPTDPGCLHQFSGLP